MNGQKAEFRTVSEALAYLKTRTVSAVFVWANLYGNDGDFVKVSKSELTAVLRTKNPNEPCRGSVDMERGEMFLSCSPR